MTSPTRPGFLHLLTAFGLALARGILGKSSYQHISQYTGNAEYWDRVVAAQSGWPQKRPAKSESASPASH
jgi:hypothetical protein